MFSNATLMSCTSYLSGTGVHPVLTEELKIRDKAAALAVADIASDLLITQSWETFGLATRKRTKTGITADCPTPFSLDHSVGFLLAGSVEKLEVAKVIKSPALTQVKTVQVANVSDGVFLTTHFSEHVGLVARRKFYQAMKERKVAGADLQIAALTSKIAESESDLSAFPTGALWSDGTGTFYKTVQGGILGHIGNSVPTPIRVIDFATDTLLANADLSALYNKPGANAAQIKAMFRAELFEQMSQLLGNSVDVGSIRPNRLPVADLEVLKRDAATVVGSPAFIVDCIGTVIDEITVLGATDISRSAAIALTKRLGVTSLSVRALPRSITDFLANYANVRDYPFLRSVEAFYQHKAGFDVVSADADFYRSAQYGELQRVHPAMLLDYVNVLGDGVTADLVYDTPGGGQKDAQIRYLDPRKIGVNYRAADGGGANAIRRMHAVMDYIFSWICFPEDETIAISVEHLRQLGVEGVNRKVGFAMS